jgi:ATP-dependent DNA helicase RecG
LGRDVAVITVTPSDTPPVRYNGRTYIRIGSRKGLASAQDERILNEKRRFLDVSFDIHGVASATVNDLNARLFEEEYLPAAVAPDVLEANERTFQQRLAAAKMVVSTDNPTPTVLGVLTLGVRPTDFLPGAYIQFLRIDGGELADPVVDESRYDGPVADLIRRIEEKLESHNRVAVDFTRGPTETRTPTYPAAALQQIVRNAVMHRTYESTNAPIRIYWFNDRIEIYSPGGPFGSVTAENFGQPGAADYRNPNLAEALRVLGFVQRFGADIATAQRALAKNGNPPLRFETSQSAVICSIEKRV